MYMSWHNSLSLFTIKNKFGSKIEKIESQVSQILSWTGELTLNVKNLVFLESFEEEE